VDQRNGFNLDLKLPTLAGDIISSGRELKHFAPRNRAKKCLCRKIKITKASSGMVSRWTGVSTWSTSYP
jgi:hypothetical protein